jgi:GTP cyclohydrolase II
MLATLGVPRVRLLSSNPDKAEQLSRLGVDVVERVPTSIFLSPANADYLAAKAAKAAEAEAAEAEAAEAEAAEAQAIGEPAGRTPDRPVSR